MDGFSFWMHIVYPMDIIHTNMPYIAYYRYKYQIITYFKILIALIFILFEKKNEEKNLLKTI